jgi:hypothetical protein
MTMDIKDFYLITPMTRYIYMRLRLADMPDDVVDHYKLRELATPDGAIYCEIRKGMYGLPQAGIIAQQLLEERLAKHGYRQSATTPGLWNHDTRPICFSLIVDNFGAKNVGEEHAHHLLETIRQYYKCSADWEGEHYCGLTLKWDYTGRKVHLSMPGYVNKALTRFKHPPPRNPNTDHTHTPSPIMAQRRNTLRRRTHCPHWIMLVRNSYRRCAAFFFSLREQLMADCSPLSAPSRPSKQTRRKKQRS